MTAEERYAAALQTSEALQREIDQTYPRDQWVGVSYGKIVADGATVEEFEAALAGVGLSISDVAVTRAGHKPERRYLGFIGTSALLGHWIKCMLPADA